MRKIFLFFIITVFSIPMRGQGYLPLQKQYLLNDYVLNPAVAGSKAYNPATIGYRKQWVGIEDAPVLETVSFHGLLFGYRVGLGVSVFNSITGPTSVRGGEVSYAYQFPVVKGKSKIAFGVSAMAIQILIDEKGLKLSQPGDNAITGKTNKAVVADATGGIYFFPGKFSKQNFFAGFSVTNMLQKEVVKWGSTGTLGLVQIPRHYYLTGGYGFKISKILVIEPSFMVKTSHDALTKPKYDFNGKIYYKDAFWIGGSYRTDDVMMAMIGIGTKTLKIAYAYDINMSNIRNYNLGSHEIVISIYFSRREVKTL